MGGTALGPSVAHGADARVQITLWGLLSYSKPGGWALFCGWWVVFFSVFIVAKGQVSMLLTLNRKITPGLLCAPSSLLGAKAGAPHPALTPRWVFGP